MTVEWVVELVLNFWPASFLLTLVVELPLYVAVSRKRVPVWTGCLAGAVCSATTHPLLWFVWPLVVKRYVLFVVTGELLVLAIEGAVFYALTRPTSWTLSYLAGFVANAASLGVSLILIYWF